MEGQALLGLCKRRLGNEAKARVALEKTIPHLEAGKFKTSAEIEWIESLYWSGDLDRAQADQNHPAEALPYLEKSVQLDGLNPTTHYELGMLYGKLGRRRLNES